MKFENTEKALSKISQDITWDNWINEDSKLPDDYWKVTQVLQCQLLWVIEEANLSEEHKNIVTNARNLIQAMSKDNYDND